MSLLLGHLALTLAAAFAGAALYVSVAEHPARMGIDDRALLAQWKPSYAAGKTMQASLAAIAGLLGLATWWWSADARWAVGAVLILGNWPFTMIVIMPVNHALEAIPEAQAGPASHALLEKWGRLHAVRAALGAAATGAYLWAAA